MRNRPVKLASLYDELVWVLCTYSVYDVFMLLRLTTTSKAKWQLPFDGEKTWILGKMISNSKFKANISIKNTANWCKLKMHSVCKLQNRTAFYAAPWFSSFECHQNKRNICCVAILDGEMSFGKVKSKKQFYAEQRPKMKNFSAFYRRSCWILHYKTNWMQTGIHNSI